MDMTLSEKAAYLKGLLEGMNNEDKVISLMADILRDMALKIEEQQQQLAELNEGVDSIVRDLDALEEELFDDHGDIDDIDDGDIYDPDDYDDDGEELFEDEDLYELTCPTCGDTVCINGAMLAEGSIDCPNCGEKLEFDTEDIEDIDEDEEDFSD